MPPLIEEMLRSLLGQMADIVGEEYRVCFIAKNNRRSNADILLGDKPLNNVVLKRMGAMLEVKTAAPPTTTNPHQEKP